MSDEAGAHGDPGWRERERERMTVSPLDHIEATGQALAELVVKLTDENEALLEIARAAQALTDYDLRTAAWSSDDPKFRFVRALDIESLARQIDALRAALARLNQDTP